MLRCVFGKTRDCHANRECAVPAASAAEPADVRVTPRFPPAAEYGPDDRIPDPVAVRP